MRRQVLMGCLLSCVAFAWAEDAPVAEVAAEQAAPQQEKVYARVNGREISMRQFDAQFKQVLKDRYYHSKVPEGQEEALVKEIRDSFVDYMLLLEEAERRGLKPDEAEVEKGVAQIKDKYADRWTPAEMEAMLGEYKLTAERRSMVAALEKAVKTAVPNPEDGAVRAYYDAHPELFTEPEKLKVSMILIKVDPSAGIDVWAEALDEAKDVYKQIKAGADFAEMARSHSGDKTAANGGDMGYLHRGMLPADLHEQVSKLQTGELGAPIKGLEGFYIFRLQDKQAEHVVEFDEKVFRRAKLLLVRDMWNKAWQGLKESLRKDAKIEVIEAYRW